MPNFLKRPSIIAGFCGLLAALCAFIPGLAPLIENRAITPREGLWIIAGFLCLWISSILITVFQQLELAGDISSAHTEATRKLMGFIGINEHCIDDRWLHDKLREVVEVREESLNKRQIVRKLIEDALTEALEEAAIALRAKAFHHDFPKSHELERMRYLKSIVDLAQDYVFAVTYDGGKYIEEFWTGEFFDEYIDAHKKAIDEAHITVRRIFIVDRTVIDGTEIEKRNKLQKIIEQHPTKNPKMEIRVVCKDKLPPSWAGAEKSMLVCDDCLASESYSLNDDGNSPGYVVLNDRDAIARLKNRFQDLLGRPDENWVKKTGRG